MADVQLHPPPKVNATATLHASLFIPTEADAMAIHLANMREIGHDWEDDYERRFWKLIYPVWFSD